MKRAEQTSPEAPQDALTTMIRAAVRAELEELRTELRLLRAPRKSDELPDLLTLADAAKALKHSTKSVRRLISTGRLRSTRIGAAGRLLVPRDAITELLARGER